MSFSRGSKEDAWMERYKASSPLLEAQARPRSSARPGLTGRGSSRLRAGIGAALVPAWAGAGRPDFEAARTPAGFRARQCAKTNMFKQKQNLETHQSREKVDERLFC
jgi:hypothetical protein